MVDYVGKKIKRGFNNYSMNKDAVFLLLGIVVVLSVCYASAWLSDDAMITFRTVLNFNSGYGMRWNVMERAQSFTHPLWFFVLSAMYFIVNELFYSTLYLCLVLTSCALIYLIVRYKASTSMKLLVLLAMLMSKSFIDFSTSGLESSLSYLLIIVLTWRILMDQSAEMKSLFWHAVLAGLLMLNRLDYFLLVGPILVYLMWSHVRPWKVLGVYMVAFIPLVVWIFFSILYYGYPFPNTAYAKLNTGIDNDLLLEHGVYYFMNSLRTDTVTLLVITVSCAVSIYSLNGKRVCLSLGLISYLVYVAIIGGDFMSGRFFAVPFVMAVALLVSSENYISGFFTRNFNFFLNLKLGSYQIKDTSRIFNYSFGVVILIFGLTVSNPTLLSAGDYANIEVDNGIADERGYSYFIYGMKGAFHDKYFILPLWERSGEMQVVEKGSIGWNGLNLGPNVHIIDIYALADPFLSHFPAGRVEDFRVGHYIRRVPKGYSKAVLAEVSHLHNPDFQKYYEVVRQITRGGLFSIDRLKKIYWMNIGHYDELLEGDPRI